VGTLDDQRQGTIEELIPAFEIQAVEVYHSKGAIPEKYDQHNGCGVVLVWTINNRRL
jgi:hypothetical protein